ncbi:hypothetical protein FRB98_007808 [Tulasnella sp. 332]|nr:hypothetical protein FRB98_007808 [Tulasnella sp. 332]
MASHRSTDPGETEQYIRGKVLLPFTTRQVCKQWRDVTLTTHQAWTTAAVVGNTEWYSKLAEHVHYSNGLSMHLDIVQGRTINADKEKMKWIARFQASTLGAHFRTVRIIATTYYGIQHLVYVVGNHLGGPTSTVEELELVRRGDDEKPSSEALYAPQRMKQALIPLKSLQRITFTGYTFEDLVNSLPSPNMFLNLQRLCLVTCDVFALRILLVLDLPALRSLMLDFTRQPRTQPTAAPILHRPITPLLAIRYLVLYNLPTLSDIRYILAHAPNASHVALSLDENYNLLETIERRIPGVKTLTLRGDGVSCQDISKILSLRKETLLEVVVDATVEKRDLHCSETRDLELIRAQAFLNVLDASELEATAVFQRWEDES